MDKLSSSYGFDSSSIENSEMFFSEDSLSLMEVTVNFF